MIFTTLHAGPTWDHHSPHVHVGAGSYGIGACAVNALCERLEVRTHRDGHAWEMAFARGKVVTSLTDLGPSPRRGTRIRFLPDPAIFTNGRSFDHAVIQARLGELAWLNPLLAITWRGESLPGQGGVAVWLRELAAPIASGHVVHAHRVIEEADVHVALAWRESHAAPEIRSFVGQRSSREGGTHVQGVWDGLVSGVVKLAPELAPEARRELLSRGLVAIVDVGLHAPHFAGPTRDRLNDPIARAATARVVHDAMERAIGMVPIGDFLDARLSSPRV